MDIKTTVAPLLKWWWLLLSAIVIAAGSSYWYVSQQPPIYQARSTLIVGRAVYEANPSGGEFYLNQQLASFYADLARRQPMREATMAALGLGWLPGYSVRPLPNSQLIEITVTDSNPIRAQAVANELANQLIKQSPTSSQNQQPDRQAFVNEQLTTLETEIVQTQQQITDKEQALTELNSAREIASTQADLSALRTKLALLQTNYATLLSTTSQGAANTLTVLEVASLPTTAIGPDWKTTVLLSVLLALGIAAGAAYLLEYLDDTIKTAEDVTRAGGLPTVGNIGRIDGKDDSQRLVAAHFPLSPSVEAFRVMRMSLQFSALGKPLKTVLITSPNPKEGKSLILANLAVISAQAGLKVIVVDTDLRLPKLHTIFGVDNDLGLGDAILNPDRKIAEYLKATETPNLHVLTSGPLPPNPAEVLESQAMDTILKELTTEADLVLFDSPPVLFVADPVILGTRVDGVLMVNDTGYTRTGDMRRSVEALRRVRANLLGVVLNRQGLGRMSKYQYYSQAPVRPEKTRPLARDLAVKRVAPGNPGAADPRG